MENKNSQTAEAIKTIILAMLVISLVILVVVYIGGTHIYQAMTKNDEKKVFDKLWSVQSGQRSDGLDKSRLLPEIIGYSLTNGEPLCTIADRSSTESLYELVAPCIIELFGSSSTCKEMNADEGKLIYSSALSSSEYVYLRWHEPTLYQLIYAYSSGRLAISESDTAIFSKSDNESGAYIKEMIIIPENDVAAHRFTAIATDSNGRYFIFKRNAEAVASDFHISKLSDASSKITTQPFEFSTDELQNSEPVILNELLCEDISAEYAAMPDEEETDILLKLFGYNPDKLKTNPYDSDGMSYYDSHSRIRLKTGCIDYRAFDQTSGIELSQLLGYSVDDGYSLFDKLAAVDYLMTSLYEISPDLIGNEAKLCLGNVYNNNGMLVFEYFYTYNNIRLSEEISVKAAFTQTTIFSFELTALSCKPSGETTLVPTSEYILRKLDTTGKLTDAAHISVRLLYDNEKVTQNVIIYK